MKHKLWNSIPAYYSMADLENNKEKNGEEKSVLC
jgi:hypothetical protein